jgi:hypothetical protein
VPPNLNAITHDADSRSMSRRWGWLALAAALLAFGALRAATVFTVAFNWDEFALFNDVARTAADGQLYASGHPGLPQAALLPLVRGCSDEIAVGRIARGAWLLLTWGYLAGVFTLLWQILPGDRHRLHDAALGTALLGLLPAFLEWSIQVRTDQVALVGGVWGAVALLASRTRPWLALAAGVAFGIGWLGTQKLAYVAALAALLAAGDSFVRGEWRPRRELARAGGLALSAALVLVAWRVAMQSAFELAPGHAAVSGTSPESLRSYLDIFDFYRATIGYSQYRDALPTLVPHAALFAAMIAISVIQLVDLRSPAARCAELARACKLLVLAWAVLALGLAVALFHAAAFAYFLMTLGLFAAAGLALALPALRSAAAERWPDAARLAAPVLWAALLLGAGMQTTLALHDSQAVQRESLRFVHRNFAPDRAGFQPETALFCGVKQPIGLWFSQLIYRTFEGPQRERAIERMIARFRAEPVHYLVHSFRLNQFPAPLREFWDTHYQPYRASVFVAGRFLKGNAGESTGFDLIMDGPYRWIPVGDEHAISIDGEPLAPTQVRFLRAASHTAAFAANGTRGVLVLALEEPPRDAPRQFYKAY